ncbi:MAG: type IV pilus assembly protein PilM [Planctomycetota bacterium]
MANPKAAWGIEVGSYAIKAIRLEREGDDVRVSDFAVIPHKLVLTTPDLDQDEMTRLTLGQFISRHALEGEHMVVSVPGHSAFARFAKLPPVEPKKVPDIVKFEAVQQIPFPIEEVEWDYQTFHDEDSPEVEVGIFAITRERVQHMLSVYGELGVTPESLNLSPVSVYNAVSFDHGLGAQKGPVLYVDIGTSATDVVVAEEGRVWIRTFPLGGTHFTEAIASAFKLSYSKAEKLKLEAATSKYAKQIMSAMRPVFSDLLQDLQRSIGYYSSLHRDNELSTMIGLGSTFKIPGLRKFLGQQLQMDVARLDEFKRITVTGREAATFAESTVNMATAYGLALQGVGLARIDANLVPVTALREQMWHSKTKWFGAAAAIMIIGASSMLLRPMRERAGLGSELPREASNVLTNGSRLKSEYENLRANSNPGAVATNMVNLLDYRRVWPYLLEDVSACIASSEPQPELLGADLNAIQLIDPEDRRLVELEQLGAQYVAPPNANGPRVLEVTMDLRLSHDKPFEFLNETLIQWLIERAGAEVAAGAPYKIVDRSWSIRPSDLAQLTVSEDGTLASAGSSRSGSSRSGSGGTTLRDNNNRGGGGSFAGSASGDSGGGSGRGRSLEGSGRSAPGGSNFASSTDGTSGPTRSGSGNTNRSSDGGAWTSTTDDSGTNQTAEQGEAIERLGDMNTVAPVPGEPGYLPAGSTFYRIPVSFQIEIIPPQAPATSSDDDLAFVMPTENQTS